MRSLLNFIHYSSWFILPLILFSIINFGNYSFLTYTLDGRPTLSILNNIKYVRILLAAIPILILFGSNQRLITLYFTYLVKNFDIFLLLCIVVIRMYIDVDIIYPLWFLFSVLSFVLMFLVLRLLSKNPLQYLQKVLIFIFVCGMITIPFTFISIPKLFSSPDIYFSSKSSYAYFNLIMIVATLAYFVVTNGSLRIKHIIFIGLNVLVILLSGRRTPLITAFVAVLIYTMLYSRNLKANLVTLAIFFVLFSNSYFNENFFSLRRLNEIDLQEEGYDDSYRARIELRGRYLHLLEQSDLLGIGFETYETSSKTTLSTHNTYLTSFLILGFFGGTLYILILLHSLLRVLFTSNRRIIIPYLILFLPLITINWVESNFMPGQIFFIYTISVLISPRFLK